MSFPIMPRHLTTRIPKDFFFKPLGLSSKANIIKAAEQVLKNWIFAVGQKNYFVSFHLIRIVLDLSTNFVPSYIVRILYIVEMLALG